MEEFFQPYNNIATLQAEMERMDDSEQRRFMRRLSMETHVSLQKHIESEVPITKKVEEMHAALFDPVEGLVNLRKWMCRIITWIGISIGTFVSLLAGIASAGHSFGWW